MLSLLSYVGGGEDGATAFCRRQVRRMTRACRGLARGSAGCGHQPTASRGVLVSFKESTDWTIPHLSLNQRVQHG
jgi:hypothetical protein